MEILNAARRCFVRSGFHAASMGQICAEVGMSPGALYRYFRSKDAIIEAIAEDKHRSAASCLEPLDAPGPLLDRLVHCSMVYFRSARETDGSELMIEIFSESLRNTTVGAGFHRIEDEVREQFRAALRSAQASGEIGGEIDIDVVLTALMGTGSGLYLRMLLEPDFAVERLEPYMRRMLAGLLGIAP